MERITLILLTGLNAVSAVVFFTVDSTAVMPLIPANLFSLPSGNYAIGMGPSYVPACTSLLQCKAPGFGPGEFATSYSLFYTVPLYAAPVLGFGSV